MDTISAYYKNFQYGLISGLTAIVVSHPIDTIKTNIQESKPIVYRIKNLYKGLSAPLLGVGLEKSIVFGVFETTKPFTQSDVISGGLSGLAASFVVTPFERIKILFQTNQGGWKFISQNLNRKFMFQGLSATFYRETPGFAIYFSVYNYLKDNRLKFANALNLHKDMPNQITMIESFCYGAISGSTAWIFIYPQDRIKTHIQAISNRNVGFVNGFREILSDGGYRGLYKGFHFALMRAIPLHATAFVTMEFCKEYL
jgi:solute carrier family 25 carnitine/acylcarnitine transporter 20/29